MTRRDAQLLVLVLFLLGGTAGFLLWLILHAAARIIP